MSEPIAEHRQGLAGIRQDWRSDLEAAARRYVEVRVAGHRFRASTAQTVRYTLDGLVRSVGPVAPADLERHHIEAWLAGITTASTAGTHLAQVRGFCRWLMIEGVLAADPTFLVKAPRGRRTLPRALAADPVSQLLAVCPDSRARFVVVVEVYLGLRAAEVAALRFEDIETGEIRITGKGGHQRLLPMLPQVREALYDYLADYPADADGGPIVRAFARDGRHKAVVAVNGVGISAAYVSTLVSRWMKKARIKVRPGDGVSGHALRHTCATDSLRNGAQLRDVQRALGHVSIATTERYLALEIHGVKDALAGRHYGPQATGAELAPSVLPPPSPEPGQQSAAGDLIGAFQVLAGALERIAASIEQVAAGAAPLPAHQALPAPEEPEWPVDDPAGFVHPELGRRRRCPECDRSFINLGAHLKRGHGWAAVEWDCDWAEPHGHTTGGKCVCPLCNQTSAAICWGGTTMADHHARQHFQCPDCDRSFIDLASHRRRAHPWTIGTAP